MAKHIAAPKEKKEEGEQNVVLDKSVGSIIIKSGLSVDIKQNDHTSGSV